MHKAALETIRTNSAALRDSMKSLQTALEATKDAQDKAIDIFLVPPDLDYSISDVEGGVETLISLIDGLEADQSIVVPRSQLDALAGKITELKDQVEAARAALDTPRSSWGGLRSIDVANFILIANNNQTLSFVKNIRRMFVALDSALVVWYQLRAIVAAPKLSEFGRALKSFSSSRAEVSEIVAETKKLRKIADDEKAKVSDIVDKVGADGTEVARLLKDAQNDRKTLAEYAAEGTAKLTEVQTSHASATNLSGAVSEYRAAFSRFDEQLKAREEKFIKENEDLSAVHSRLKSNEQEITRLISESEGMLRGATNVGLAASFSALQGKINNELRWARASFYFSIFLLVALSMPIAIYVFPGLQILIKSLSGIDAGLLLPKGGETHATTDVLAQVLARALLLIPGIWMVRFASARHERLFRLREHYSYKYSIASSVEGFKRQAPELEQGIAAAAFYELTFNPATRMDANSEEARHPNFAIEWVMKKLGGGGEGK